MGNKAKNDKNSILIDTENILDVFEPAFMRMPKIRRIHGSAVRFEDACYDLIDNFYRANELTNRKEEISDKIKYSSAVVGAFGRMQSTFKRLMKIDLDNQKVSSEEAKGKMCLMSDGVKLEIARNMERLEEGIVKWRGSLRSSRIMFGQWSAEKQEGGRQN